MTTTTRNQEVAATIASQLGGTRRLKMFVNGRDFVAIEDGLQFKFSGARGMNVCRITLDPSDTYNVEFGYLRGLNYKVKASHDGIYCDMLVELFENTTKLFLHF